MAKTLTKLASFFRPLGGRSDDLVAVKLHQSAVTVAEIRHNSNVINIDTIASVPLTSIAHYYSEEFTTVVDGLSAIIEPLMIVFVGWMIGVMVVALNLPIFSAGDAIK